MLKRFIQINSPVLRYSMATISPKIQSSDNPGPIESKIIEKIVNKLNPTFLKIANDSAKHAHHAGIRGASNTTESHFRVEVVSEAFQDQKLPARHRLIYSLLDDEFTNHGLHALQLKTKTPKEVNQ